MKEDLEKPVNKFKTTILALLLALPMLAQVENDVVSLVDTTSGVSIDTVQPAEPLPVIEYTLQPKTYEIADIKVTGADSYEDFVLIGFSGLAVGDKIEVPGDQITKSLKRFWKQGLFSDIKFKATKIEGDKIWLEIALKQRPRVSDIVYTGLRKTEQEDLQVKVGIQKGGQMTPDLADRAKKIISKYLNNWNRLWETNVAVYTPIHNYDMYEERDLATTDDNVETTDGELSRTGTEGLTHGMVESTQHGRTEDNVNYKYGLNTTVYQQNRSDENVSTEGGTTTTTDSGTDTTTRNLVDSTDQTVTEDNEGTEHEETHRYGNIGVTTTQKLLQEERNLWLWNFFDEVFNDLDKELALAFHDPCRV